MDDSNSITLVNQLCESFLPTGSIPATCASLKRLKTLVFSQLFKPTHNSDTSEDDLKVPCSLLKTDILCQAVKNYQNEVNSNTNVDKMFNTIEKRLQEYDPDIQQNIFLFLHELSKLNETKEIAHRNKKCRIPVNENNILFSTIISYEDLDWSAFYNDPLSISTSCLEFPFHEEPGVGIPFFKEHIADFKLPSSKPDGFLDMSYKVWRFDLNKQVETMVQDEGFVTPGSEFSAENSVNDDLESHYSDKLSELDISGFNLNIPIKRSWDRLGNDHPFRELPFSSESTDSVIHLWKIANSRGVKCLPIGVQVTFGELIVDLRYLLFGVASYSFYFNEETRLFEICDRLHTATLSPEILASGCGDMLECANYFYSLKTFAEERLRLTYGSIHITFCKCIEQVLNMYRYCLLRLEWPNIKYLSNLQTLILPLHRKLTFLAKFCLISIDERTSGLKFPSGAQLLDYLYGNLSKIYGSELGYMLFFMFESCCNAYLRIVSEWIFDGCFSNPDNYAEFFIEIRREYEICRDWRRVSCIGVREKKVPKFLDKFFKEIFVCGKSINLLKICSSKEILDTLVEKNHPNLACCFNQRQMTEYETKWRKYKATFEEHFGDKIRIKDKLFKNCDNADFYERINRVRENWFREKELSKKLENEDNSPIPNEINEEKSAEVKSTAEQKNSEIHSEPPGNETNNPKASTDPEPSAEDNPESINLEPKSQVTVAFTSTDLSDEKSSDNEPRNPTSVPTPPQTPSLGAGDCVKNSENKRVKQLVSLLEQKSKYEKITPGKSPKQMNLGAGDALSTPSTTKVLKDIGNVSVPSEYTKNRLRAMSTTINSPAEENIAKFSKTAPLSACQENKLKVMSSEYHCRLNDSLNTSHEMPKTKTTVLSACQENKLKVMSSEYHARLNDSLNSSQTEAPKQNKPLTALQENKLKVMTSEYHNRLSITTPEEPVRAKAKLSICDENKLRVMTSEYHVRLNESFSEKSTKEPEKPEVLSALQENKLKVMSSEYHRRLSTSSVVEESPNIQKPLSISEENKLKVMSSEYHRRLSTPVVDESPKIQKPLTVSEENKLKVMSSEYHIRLQNSNEPEQDRKMKELTECQKNKLKVMSSEYHCRMNHDADIEDKFNASKILAEKVLNNEIKNRSHGGDNLSNITEENDSINPSESSQLGNNFVKSGKMVRFGLENELKFRSLFKNRLENFDLQSIESVDINSISDVDTTSLEYYLAQSIAVPLRIQMKLVNEAILRVFIEEEYYLDHLTSLRDYLLLRKPEFTVSLTNSIFKLVEKAKKPYMLTNNYTLSSILQRALLATGTKETITFGKKLSFVAEGEMPEIFTLVDIKELDCLTLNYSIKWPINILITEPIMKKYCKIFKFLLQIQRVLWVLKRDFISLKNLKLGKSIQYMKIQLFRHNMTQVVKIIQDYVMREALETCWNNFVDNLTSSEIDLDVLYMSHLKYINKTMQRCFLCDVSSPCRESILNLFSVILKYHEALKAGVWRRNVEQNFLYHTNFKSIDSIYAEFVKNFNLVRADLRTLVYEKQKMYYNTLYLELSKNDKEEM